MYIYIYIYTHTSNLCVCVHMYIYIYIYILMYTGPRALRGVNLGVAAAHEDRAGPHEPLLHNIITYPYIYIYIHTHPYIYIISICYNELNIYTNTCCYTYPPINVYSNLFKNRYLVYM